MIMIGRMAEKYGVLPSEVLARATTYDLMITDALATYDAYQQQKAEGNVDPSLYKLNDDEMLKILEKARG